MQRNRKTAAENSRRKKTQQKMEAFLNNPSKAQEEYCQTLEEYLQSNDLHTSFHQLHLYLDRGMMCQMKKQVYLEDGVYVLLDGSLTYVWTKNRHDRDRREHLFALARLGSYSNLAEGTTERDNFLAYGYSLMIGATFAVLEAEGGNLATNEDCTFLRIPPRVLELTEFFKLKSQRIDIFNQAKLPGARLNPLDSLISLNHNLHHTFKTRKLVFRNKIEVQTLGIVTKGTAVLKSTKCLKKVQLLKHCIMLPDFQYEVSSAELQMIEIIRNPTLSIRKPILLKNFIKEFTVSLASECEIQQKSEVKKYTKRIMNSISTHKAKNQQHTYRKDEPRKKKENSLFSKQNEDYWVVSMELCRENMNNIRRFKKNHVESEEKYKKPRILFNFSKKERSKDAEAGQNKSQCGQSSFYDINAVRTNCNFLNSNNSLMERYEMYAKQMFDEYKKFNLRKKEGTVHQSNLSGYLRY